MTVRTSARARVRALAVVGIAGVVAALALAAPVAPAPRAAASAPELSGAAFGIELCPQFVCGAATFIGYFGGDVDGRPRGGWWTIAVRHDDLPDPGADAAITGGRWSLSVGGSRASGAVAGGSIRNHGDDTFAIAVTLAVAGEPRVPLTFSGTLDHRVFPPTARGSIVTSATGAAGADVARAAGAPRLR